MIEIIPNWHPFFVHFTVALLSLTVVFHVAHAYVSQGMLKQQLSILANWNLWLGTGFGIITAIAGWFAYNSVAHDAASHEAMTEHRNIALVTLGIFILLTAWSVWRKRQERLPGKVFLIILIIGGGFLSSTAWHGAEAVYRYGLGVISLPEAEVDEHGHGHSHNHGVAKEQTHAEEGHAMQSQTGQNQEMLMHDHSTADAHVDTHDAHQHGHDATAVEQLVPELQNESEVDEPTQDQETQDAHDHSGHQH